jgi:protoporphyrinogen oxidase
MDTSKKIGIIGAGPAGITAAYCLAKEGVHVELFEASPEVGGLSKSIDLWNQRVDLGPHRFFSSDTRVNALWLEVSGNEYEMVRRLTRILYKNRYFHYPLKPFDALKNLGPAEAASCMLSYSMQKFRPADDDGTFEKWVVRRFGRRLFEIFFKTYSEKLWGIGCHELDADFAAQRIKKLSLFEAVKNAFFKGNGNTHKTLVDEFAYPLRGTGMIYENMRNAIHARGGTVTCNAPVKKVHAKDGTATSIELESGELHHYDHIISSMPITQLVSRLPGVPDDVIHAAHQLKFRNTILVYLKVNRPDLFPDNWLYVHSDDLQTGRMTNFRNWVPQLYGDTRHSIIALEYWCYDEDPLWKDSDDNMINLGKKELSMTGMASADEIDEGFVYRIRRCYPVYSRGYKDFLKPVEEYLASVQNLSVIGRYGSFKYNNQDHSILMGMLAAENILKGTKHNLWDINTDYENYQEASTITKSGLIRKQ